MTLDARQTNRRKALEWYTCTRCDVDYPRSKVVVHNGAIVCFGEGTHKCKDQPGRSAFYKEPLPHEKPILPLPEEVEIL